MIILRLRSHKLHATMSLTFLLISGQHGRYNHKLFQKHEVVEKVHFGNEEVEVLEYERTSIQERPH